MAYPQATTPPETVAVAPTPTTMGTWDVQRTARLAIQVTNTDGAQTLACTIQRRVSRTLAFADTTIPDLSSIAPGATAAVDVDCAADVEVRLVGTASGAGLNASVAARNVPQGFA
jgi:hypothetical protein